MNANLVERKTQKRFLDLTSAAFQAGYNTRLFRKIIEEDHIPVLQIGRKTYIQSSDLEEWKWTKGEARLDRAIQQLDGWLKQSAKAAMEPAYDFQDEE